MNYKYKDKISIVIPTYNRASLLKKSVDSLLKQTYDNFEVIVVDDASSDNTESVMKKIKDERVKYIKLKKNSGACVARNTGIKASTGKYITFNDSDDEYLPEKLEKQYNNLIKNKSDMDFCRLKVHINNSFFVVPSDECIKMLKKGKYVDELTRGNYISTQAIFVKKEKILKYMFDDDLPRLQDYDLVLRMIPNLKISFTNEILANLYNSKDSIGNSKEKLLNAMKIIINKNYNFTDEQYKSLRLYLINLYGHALETEHIKCDNKINELQQKINDLQQSYDTLLNQYHSAQNSINELEDYNSKLLNSRSWKITKPLRALSGKTISRKKE